MHCCLIASDAIQLDAEPRGAPFWRGNPEADLPRRIMTNVLAVPTSEFGHPVPFVILVKTNDWLVHCVWATDDGRRATDDGHEDADC
jgi:hypothetical protein